MKSLQVPFLSSPINSLTQLSTRLDSLERHPLRNGWFQAFPYQPAVSFSIGHGGDSLYVKYYVQEQTILARYYASNDPVYRDSCVEVFIAFDERDYYNLEFNCLGTCLMQFGPDRANRMRVADTVIEKIERQALMSRALPQAERDLVTWELTLRIPVSAFYAHDLSSLNGKRARANFQKCGDDTPQPHFLSWNKIDTPEPDFHQPRFFGELTFLT